MLRGAYRLITDLAGPALPLWLGYRARRGKEDPTRLDERRGIAGKARPAGRIVWFHAASVGEALSVLQLVGAVAARGWQPLITTGTITSARLLAERLPAGAIHQFVPLDRSAWVRRFLDHWRPDLVLWTESELWPNTLCEIAARKIPAVLINARLSDRAFRGWRRWPVFARDVLAAFDAVLAQSHIDCAHFAALGARDVRTVGNIKLAASPLPADDAALAVLRGQIGERPRWLASSIHPGEDAIAGAVHRALKHHHPTLLTLIVPRHPQRGTEMAAALTAAGLNVAQRSTGAAITADTDIYIADTMGELGLFYRLCDIAFMGKSLAVGGGQNPAEAAQLGCALVLGPDMSNFTETTAEFLACGAAVQVRDTAGLTAAMDRLLRDAATRRAMNEAARAAMARHANAVAETLAHLSPYLDRA
jgi:3-deoxy-D-manno-octulosonic-acid transferase